jgi:hypothetical protein
MMGGERGKVDGSVELASLGERNERIRKNVGVRVGKSGVLV